MTIKEFWDSEENLAINCKTRTQANIFCKASDRLGKKMNNGTNYTENDSWGRYAKNFCYTNDGYIGDKNGHTGYVYKILNFEDINFNPILITQTKYIAAKDNTVLTLGGFKPLNTDAQVKLYPAPCTAKADLEKTYGTYEGVKFVKVKVSIEEVEE